MADVHIAEKIIEKYRLKRSREFFGNDLLLPERIRDEKEMAGMDADQKHKSSEKEKEKEKAKEKAEAEAKEQQRATETALKNATLKRAIQMFSDQAIDVLEKHAKLKNDEDRPRFKQYHELAKELSGRREMPTFRNIAKELNQLRYLFGNFADVLDFYSDELFFAGLQKPDAMRVKPILLDGEPGVGKTAFAQAIAKKLGLPFLKLAPSNLQHGFVLSGTASHWSSAAAGEVFNLLAGSQKATAVLLFDEVDKISDNPAHPVLPGLLDLLEPETSRMYRDDCLGITFDASHLIVILTSNNVSDMDAALLSRCDLMKIKMPGTEQKLAVALDTFDKLNASLPNRYRKRIDAGALDKLVEYDMDMRSLISAIQKAFSLAVKDGKQTAVPVAGKANIKKNERIGF